MNVLKILGIFSLAMMCYSCEDIIDVKLDSSSESIIIEGLITTEDIPGIVSVTKSVDYFKPGNVPKVTEANVEIITNDIIIERLVQFDSGQYRTYQTQGIPGAAYTLNVMIDGITYSATSTMPKLVVIDSLTFEFLEKSLRSKAGYEVNLNFSDPVVVDNFYKIEVYRNNKLFPDEKTIRIRNDKYSDGKRESVNLNGFQSDGVRFEINDTIRVKLYSIDKQVYTHFNTFRTITGGGFGGSSSTPANPTTNFTNGALGYFGAVAVSEKMIIIK